MSHCVITLSMKTGIDYKTLSFKIKSIRTVSELTFIILKCFYQQMSQNSSTIRNLHVFIFKLQLFNLNKKSKSFNQVSKETMLSCGVLTLNADNLQPQDMIINSAICLKTIEEIQKYRGNNLYSCIKLIKQDELTSVNSIMKSYGVVTHQ